MSTIYRGLWLALYFGGCALSQEGIGRSSSLRWKMAAEEGIFQDTSQHNSGKKGRAWKDYLSCVHSAKEGSKKSSLKEWESVLPLKFREKDSLPEKKRLVWPSNWHLNWLIQSGGRGLSFSVCRVMRRCLWRRNQMISLHSIAVCVAPSVTGSMKLAVGSFAHQLIEVDRRESSFLLMWRRKRSCICRRLLQTKSVGSLQTCGQMMDGWMEPKNKDGTPRFFGLS